MGRESGNIQAAPPQGERKGTEICREKTTRQPRFALTVGGLCGRISDARARRPSWPSPRAGRKPRGDFCCSQGCIVGSCGNVNRWILYHKCADVAQRCCTFLSVRGGTQAARTSTGGECGRTPVVHPCHNAGGNGRQSPFPSLLLPQRVLGQPPQISARFRGQPPVSTRLVAQKGVGYTISTILVWEGRACSV